LTSLIIYTESLVVDSAIPISATFQDDLACLQDESVLPIDSPAYILAKLDDSPDWLAIFYVPDNAKIRDKVRLSQQSTRDLV
jgi:twinfilin